VFTGFAGVGRDGLVGGEVFIALNGKSERTAQIPQFVHAHKAELLGPSTALALRARLRRTAGRELCR
jgi:hypothetical protein